MVNQLVKLLVVILVLSSCSSLQKEVVVLREQNENYAQKIKALTSCEDEDEDGICDAKDRCIRTPLGSRIDGNGCALDVDLDGIIDLYDKCVTVPGSKDKDGCPY